MNYQKPTKIINRLTALWAVSESGLGGFMHALKIPFTGFFLGAFAIVIISLIAFHSEKKWNAVLLATSIVMIIKAVASPQSPPTAYLAVAFQGLMGAAVYSLFTVKKISAALFGIIAMAESALQKLLILTLVFGKNIWLALDDFFAGIIKDFHLNVHYSFSFWLIAIYVFVYVLWGVFIGWWSARLCFSLNEKALLTLSQFGKIENADSTKLNATATRSKRFVFIAIVLLLMVLIFVFEGSFNKALYAFLRTIAALLLLFYIVSPVTKFLLNRWLKHEGEKKKSEINSVLDEVPEIKNYLQPAFQMAKQHHRGILIYSAFVVNWIVLSLYYEHDEA